MASATLDAAVLEAGRRAFERYGFQDTTIERIASEAGLSRVTLHRRGISKRLILDALAEAAIEDYRARMWPALTSTGSVPERLDQALSALCDAAEDHMALLLALRNQTDRVFHDTEAGEALTRTVFTEPLERLLHEGAREGTLRVLDPERTATVVFNQVGWTYVHLRSAHRWRRDDARSEVVDLCLNGLLAAPATSA